MDENVPNLIQQSRQFLIGIGELEHLTIEPITSGKWTLPYLIQDLY